MNSIFYQYLESYSSSFTVQYNFILPSYELILKSKYISLYTFYIIQMLDTKSRLIVGPNTVLLVLRSHSKCSKRD